MPSLDEYIKKFTKLRIDRVRNRYDGSTNYSAPHKPFLLLVIIDLISQNKIRENFIEPSFDLVEAWNGYWNKIMSPIRKSTMAYPFERLKSDGFWHLMPNHGYDTEHIYNASSVSALRKYYKGACFDDDLFTFLRLKSGRKKLQSVLVNTYFSSETRPYVFEQAFINYGAYRHSKNLFKFPEQQTIFDKSLDSNIQQKARDQGFRKAVVNLYEHRCSLCGLRMLTPEGYTAVEAAHIIPWSEDYDDRLTNGMALCKLCHWSFDMGLMGVGKEYEVLISKSVRIEKNILGHMLTLMDRPIFKPNKEKFWPDQKNLMWHREKIYLK